MPQREVSSPAALAWKQLCAYLNEWYYKPDTEALRVALSAAMAHYAIEGDPAWLMVIGPSSSGKTAIVMNSLAALPKAHIMGDVSAKTFISHYRGESSGLLHRLGASGILLFKDFTTILSKREQERDEIIAQLREIYDGEWSRETGVGGVPLWRGKMTMIAACTPAFEDHWAVKRELGDRFVQVRWKRSNSFEMARWAAQQRGKEAIIKKTMQELTLNFCKREINRPEPLTGDLGTRLYQLSEFVARARTHVKRTPWGSRDVMSGLEGAEEPGRLSKSLELIATTHASLFERKPSHEDVELAIRVGCDSIPVGRLRVFTVIPTHGTITSGDISRLTAMPTGSVNWHLQELAALELIELLKDEVSNYVVNLRANAKEILLGVWPDRQ